VNEEKKSVIQSIIEGIVSKRWMILIFLIGLVVIAFLAIGWQILDSKLDASSVLVAEELNQAYDEYLSAKADKEKKPTTFTNRENRLLKVLESSEGKYSGRYSDFRATFIRAEMAKDIDDLATAATMLESCGLKNSHPLAAMMLMQSAVYYENNDNAKKALDVLLACNKRFPSNFINSRVVFNIGRLYEASGDNEKAREFYYSIIDEDKDGDDYSKMAQSRIIILDSESEDLTIAPEQE